MPVAETTFGVVYDGPALAAGRMPVRDLAPALLALGDLFAEASQVIYPDAGPVSLSVEATDRGSFDVRLILEAKDLWDQIVNVFGSDEVTALANLQNLVIGTGGFVGLFALIKRLRGRRITSQESLPDPGQVRITLNDGTKLEIPTDVARLHGRISIRRKVRDVVAPVAREGVDKVRFSETPGGDQVLLFVKTTFRPMKRRRWRKAKFFSRKRRNGFSTSLRSHLRAGSGVSATGRTRTSFPSKTQSSSVM
jgi:hypothetical protein